MLDKMTINTGVRLTIQQAEKLETLAATMRVSRNRVFGMLIDSAEVRSQPIVSVEVKTNRRDAQELSSQSVTAVGA